MFSKNISCDEYLVVVVERRCARWGRWRGLDVLGGRCDVPAAGQLEAGLVYADISGVIRALSAILRLWFEI